MLSHSAVLRLFRLVGQFTPVLALYDLFGVDVPLNFDIINQSINTQTTNTTNGQELLQFRILSEIRISP